jgi:hypothetical protein
MTLDQALAKAEREIQQFSDEHRATLRDQFDYAEPDELAAILKLHDDAVAVGLKRVRDIVTGAWHTGTGGIH